MSERDSAFQCTVCGECCRGNQKVWLNPTDTLRLVRHLGIGESESETLTTASGREAHVEAVLIARKIITIEPGEHGKPRPRLLFASTPVGPACRFLINDLDEDGRLWGKCSLHGTLAKPLVCRLAPLSRAIDLRSGEEEWREIPPVIGCPGWPGDQVPPPDGRLVPPPDLSDSLRADLDAETEYFRKLAGL